MNSKIIIGTFATLLTSVVFAAGPNVSGGPAPTENLKSKLKIQAVLNAINDVNDVIESVELDAGGRLYNVKIRSGESCSVQTYKVAAVNGQFKAQYVDMISFGDCQ